MVRWGSRQTALLDSCLGLSDICILHVWGAVTFALSSLRTDVSLSLCSAIAYERACTYFALVRIFGG